MQRVFRVFAGALLIAGCAGSASQAENAAQRWLVEHRQQPSADELADLKTANPMAYGIVQALLTKQSLGLVRRNPGSGSAPSKPLAPFYATMPTDPLLEPTEPLAPSMLAPPPAAVVAEGPPTELMNQVQEAPEELPELAPRMPTPPPEMPPPPPISSELPPLLANLEDAEPLGPPGGLEGDDRSSMIKRLQAAAAAPAPSAPHLSHMATSSSVSSASNGAGFGLNWHPDDMIADNERMVQNVLGAVAQLTNKHVARVPVAKVEEPLAPPAAESLALPAAEPLALEEPIAAPAAEPLALEEPLAAPAAEPLAPPATAESVETTSASDDDSSSARSEMIKKIQASSSAPDSADLHEALSHMATSSSVSSASSGGGFGLNWHPDDMIADNERMVQNVLGAVAQLTNKRVHRAPTVSQQSPDTLADKQDLRSVRPQASATNMVATPAAPTMSAADMYLAGTQDAGRRAADEIVGGLPEERDDAMAGHLPGALSWSNPYAGASVQPAAQRENSYLKEVDFGLGVPQVQPRRRTPDDENPYLQGLNLRPDESAPVDISTSALTAMHQSQLLSSHKLLSSFDWGEAKPPPLRKPQARKTVTAPKDPLVGFLGPAKGARPRNPPAAMVSKNAYLAKLDDHSAAAVASSSSSSFASNIEQNNAYMMTLDNIPVRQVPQASVPALPHVQPRDRLASFQWDDDQPQAAGHQLSMAASHQVHAKVASKIATKRVTLQKTKKKQSLSGWLVGPTPIKAPNLRALRLQRAVAQRVADARNPYLRGLDMEPQKVQTEQEEGNPYMAGLD